jgi:hypothetical protein
LYWQDDEQYCQHEADVQRSPVHERQFVPETQLQALPGRSEHAPHAQPLVHTCCEHASQVPAWVAPGVHTPPPEHEPNAVHGPQPQVGLHVRVRDCVPHAHAAVSVSVVPAVHAPSPVHVAGPQVQSAPHVREEVPQRPQPPPASTESAAHSPLELQEPAFVQAPPRQSCCCVPQKPHGTSLGGSPSTQSQAAGAVHAPQIPFAQGSTPTPQTEEHERSASLPMAALSSSQSSPAAMPSLSASTDGSMHAPERQTWVPVQAGTQPGASTSRSTTSPRSASWPRSSCRVPASTTPPLAQPMTVSASAPAKKERAARRSVDTTPH